MDTESSPVEKQVSPDSQKGLPDAEKGTSVHPEEAAHFASSDNLRRSLSARQVQMVSS